MLRFRLSKTSNELKAAEYRTMKIGHLLSSALVADLSVEQSPAGKSIFRLGSDRNCIDLNQQPIDQTPINLSVSELPAYEQSLVKALSMPGNNVLLHAEFATEITRR